MVTVFDVADSIEGRLTHLVIALLNRPLPVSEALKLIPERQGLDSRRDLFNWAISHGLINLELGDQDEPIVVLMINTRLEEVIRDCIRVHMQLPELKEKLL